MSHVPISELGTDQWSVLLPEYVDPNKIGVDFDKLRTISRMGCFSGQVSVRSYSGETTQFTPMIVGGDSHGNAYAGVGSVKQASLGEAESVPEHHIFRPFHDPHPLTVRVNTNEIQQQIQHGKANLRDPIPWAGLLDKAVSRGVEKAAWDYCVRQPNYGELIVWMAGRALGTFVSNNTLANMIISLPYNNLPRAAMAKMNGVRLRDVCYSLTPVVHVDRALLVSGLTRALKVVKPLK